MGFRIKSEEGSYGHKSHYQRRGDLPKGVLRRAHPPENGECQVEAGDHIIELRPLPEQYPSWELPEERRIERSTRRNFMDL